MTTTTVLARSLPYRTPNTETYQCERCGITRLLRTGRSPYCRDCKPYAPKDKE
jgi:lipopolysaccharide biosynthesis regulator YciM